MAHAYLVMTHLNAEGDERIKQDYLAPSIAGKKLEHYVLRNLWEEVMLQERTNAIKW